MLESLEIKIYEGRRQRWFGHVITYSEGWSWTCRERPERRFMAVVKEDMKLAGGERVRGEDAEDKRGWSDWEQPKREEGGQRAPFNAHLHKRKI